MLEEMRIRGLGVIEDATLALGPGLTVLTGETGAGKTMVVHGLALLAGGRSDATRVRPGCDKAVVEGRFVVDPAEPAAARAVAAGGELDDDVLLVARTVATDGGRARAHVGGRAVPLTVLAEVTEPMVALHGQHDQQRLRHEPWRRALLDRYAGAGHRELLTRYRRSYDTWSTTSRDVRELSARRRERAREADLLRLGLNEVAAVAPVVGEDTALAAEVSRLAHADQLRGAAEAARTVLVGDPADPDVVDALSLVAGARQALNAVAGLDGDLDAIAARLAELSYLLADLGGDVASYGAGVDTDPGRLEQAQQRQAALTTIVRKYAEDLSGVLSWSQDAAARLAELDADDDTLDSLRRAHEAAEVELAGLAVELSASRRVAARRLAGEITAELGDLAMPGATVDVTIRDAEVDAGGLVVGGRRLACARDGVDEVEFVLAAHPGAPTLPIARSASGGELARVMLAVEVVLAAADPVATMVFDEVDAGVGGRAAVEVGRRLARLARTHQVLVVTHLPQVAAFADDHLLVVKSGSGAVTGSDVTRLDGADRVRELSRMLAGLEESAHARSHAEELLAAAAADKAVG
ncbi:MAG TPA: DNA repair protein RecN [Mycobacteriales bacterium]|nr:DNA repair protein RecN [Mycobacteriales bacterium]